VGAIIVWSFAAHAGLPQSKIERGITIAAICSESTAKLSI
jgi:hypothetical protein